jgi:hypothetical protein
MFCFLCSQLIHGDLSPVDDELLLEGDAHGLVLLPPVPVRDHQLHVHFPTLQGVLPVLKCINLC